MTHPLVSQLRFVRSEFVRGLDGVTPEEGVKRFEPMNCISWTIGHMANQEHFRWVRLAQDKNIAPDLNDLVGFGKPASTPPLGEMWAVWRQVTQEADLFLDTVTDEMLDTFFEFRGKQVGESIGTTFLRNISHYWYHLGECMAVRQMLGHTDLPQFVGNLDNVKY